MRPGTDKLLAKAERAAQAAADALDAGDPDAAAGRAFYALLYAAKVVLNERGLRLRTHVRIAAALQCAAPPAAPLLAEWLGSAIARRRAGDHGELTYADAAQLVERAREAVRTVRGPGLHGG